MGFAQNLAYLMQRNAMTKYQLAKEVGCHQTSITNWLENGTMPQKRTIEAVASVFSISAVELCGDDSPRCKQKNTPTSEGERKAEILSPAFFRLKKGLEPYNISEADADFLVKVYKAHIEKNQ